MASGHVVYVKIMIIHNGEGRFSWPYFILRTWRIDAASVVVGWDWGEESATLPSFRETLLCRPIASDLS